MRSKDRYDPRQGHREIPELQPEKAGEEEQNGENDRENRQRHPADSSAHRFLLLKLETEISGEYEGAWSADSQAAGASAWNPVIFSCYIIEHGF